MLRDAAWSWVARVEIRGARARVPGKVFNQFSFGFGIRSVSGDQRDPPRTGANAVPVVLAAILWVFPINRALLSARYGED